MTLYGYARVSVREPEDKNLDLQVERLVRAGCPLGNSALARLANASFQVVIEAASYREKLSPHRKLLGDRGGDH